MENPKLSTDFNINFKCTVYLKKQLTFCPHGRDDPAWGEIVAIVLLIIRFFRAETGHLCRKPNVALVNLGEGI